MSRLFLSRWMPDMISGQDPLLILIGQAALVIGYIGFFLFSGGQITAAFLFFPTLFALGLIGLGLVLWLEKPHLQDGLVTHSSF